MTGPNSLTLNDGKAGMQGLDKERINRIIRETSKGSKFFQHAEKKEKELKNKVDKMLKERGELTEQMIKQSELELDGVLARLESARDLTRDIVHVDMDAFYAAVEMRDNPALKDVPMAVGGSAMLSTSNYLARRFGVRAAMPGFIAKKLCPGLVIVPGHHEKYSAVSSQVMEIIGKFTSEFAAMSLDEVYCDLTDVVQNRTVSPEECPEHGEPPLFNNLNGSHTPNNDEVSKPLVAGDEVSKPGLCWCRRERVVWNVVEEMRREIETTTQLTASAGLSCNTFLAKVCSDLNKPNGQYFLPSDRETIMDFVAELEIKKVPGIGRVQQAYLSALGVNKVSDLITHRGTLAHLFTPATVHSYLYTALGLGSNQVSSDEGRRSISTENTFSDTNVNTGNNKLTPEIVVMLSELSETLANRLKAENLAGETVSVKMKLATFEILQRSRTQSHAVSTKEEIEFTARELLCQLVKELLEIKPPGHRLSARLLGVRVNKFVTSTKQSSLLSFTRNSSSNSNKTWSCPVCGTCLPAQIVSFNKHVDSCIVKGDVVEPDNAMSEVKEAPNIIKPVSGLQQNHSDKGSGVSITLSSIKSGDMGASASDQRGKKRKSSEEGPALQKFIDKRWTCPICCKLVSSDLTTFNLHIDRCLNKGQQSQQSSSSDKRQRTDEQSEAGDQKQSLFKYFKRTS
ncbi:DNA polymerase kappa-like isoform X2 [Bolinopsis microptera]|uniref:DNA polymerase kappa-like isoform X2 n=1 Tax=Bolinopsis microptera TaxID=2820187 RepID=UPI00307AE44F